MSRLTAFDATPGSTIRPQDVLPGIRAHQPHEILRSQTRKLIKNEPWVVYPDAIRAKVRANYPHLFDDDPGRFHIYRLDKDALAALMESL
jgi:hypothetical protein